MVILFAVVGSVSAGGVSTIPGVITIPDALRGSTIFREVTLTNATDVAVPFTLTFEGDAASWITVVDPDDRTTPISEALDIDGTGVEILVRIDVPQDVANGTYDGSITAVLAPPDTDSGVGVGLGVKIEVTLDVSGTELIAATLGDLSINNTEVGIPARVRATINNTGNVTIVPTFEVEILSDSSVVSNTTTGGEPSFPGEQAVFEVLWDTANAEPGEYTAQVSIDFGGTDLGTSKLNFTVYPSGTLDRTVLFASLEMKETDQDPWAGALARFTAAVDNPGQVDVTTTVVGKLVKDGAQVSSFESQPFVVRAGEVVRIPLAIEVPDEGDYEFIAWVVYGDVESDPLTVAFTAVPPPTLANTDAASRQDSQGDGDGLAIDAIVIGALILVVLVGLGAWLLGRKRNGGTSQQEALEEDTDPDKQTATVGSED